MRISDWSSDVCSSDLINLIAQVAEAYLRLRAAQEQYGLVERTLASYQRYYDLVKARYDAGVASALDLNQAESQLNTAQADLQSTRRAQAQARNALQLLLGTDAVPASPKGAPFDRDQLLSTVQVGLPSTLIERRPDISGARSAGRRVGNECVRTCRARGSTCSIKTKK